MAATLTPHLDAVETPGTAVAPPTPVTPPAAAAPWSGLDPVAPGAAGDALPVVNPITVSMTLAVLFLLVVFAFVSFRPPAVDDTRGADESPAVVEEAHAGR